jgi:hypothetical protein
MPAAALYWVKGRVIPGIQLSISQVRFEANSSWHAPVLQRCHVTPYYQSAESHLDRVGRLGAFVLCVDVASGPLYQGMALFLTGSRDILWATGGDSILAPPGNAGPFPMQAVFEVIGGNLWFTEPPIVLLPYFAMSALVVLGCLRWAVRTRHVGVILLTAAWFAVPVAITLWLVTASPDKAIYLYLFQSSRPHAGMPMLLPLPLPSFFGFFSSFPLSLLTMIGEVEALMGVVFLSMLRARQALRTQRYQLLGLVHASSCNMSNVPSRRSAESRLGKMRMIPCI